MLGKWVASPKSLRRQQREQASTSNIWNSSDGYPAPLFFPVPCCSIFNMQHMGCGHWPPWIMSSQVWNLLLVHETFKLFFPGDPWYAYQGFRWTETVREALMEVDPGHKINSHGCWWVTDTRMGASYKNSHFQVVLKNKHLKTKDWQSHMATIHRTRIKLGPWQWHDCSHYQDLLQSLCTVWAISLIYIDICISEFKGEAKTEGVAW